MTPLINAMMNVSSHYYDPAADLFRSHVDIISEELFGRSKDYYPMSIREKATHIVARQVVFEMRKRGANTRRLGEVLELIGCPLEAIVAFEDRHLTKAYVQSCDPPHTHIFCETALRIVMRSADLQHLKLILPHIYDLPDKLGYLFWPLMDNIPRYHRSKAGRAFLRGVFRLDVIFSSEMCIRVLELALMHANEESLRIFLKYNFRSVIKAKTGIDILPSLFGNSKVDATSLLRDDQIDVNARGTYQRTPLHFAALYNAANNIKSLLDRNANPYALDNLNETCFWLVMNKFFFVNVGLDEKCLKLFLLAGADLLSIDDSTSFFAITEFDLRKDFTRIIKLLVAQLAIYEAQGRSIEQPLTFFYEFHMPHLVKFFDKCRRQVKLMKTHEICERDGLCSRHKFNMFTMVSGESDKIARYINQQHKYRITKFMNKRKYKRIPYYYEILQRAIEDIDQINQCRYNAMCIVSEYTGIHNIYHLAVVKIVNYLTTKDLLMFKKTYLL